MFVSISGPLGPGGGCCAPLSLTRPAYGSVRDAPPQIRAKGTALAHPGCLDLHFPEEQPCKTSFIRTTRTSTKFG